MKNRKRNLVIVVAIAIAVLSFRTLPGGEFYRITLNGKQVIEQFLTRDKSVPTLHINQFGSTDKLSILYSHCGKMGTDRVLTLKNSKETIKTWEYFSSTSDHMSVNLKELSTIASQSGSFQLVYSSKELPEGRTLAFVRFGSATASK